MSLKNGKPNPLNYFGIRRVDFPPPQFQYANLNSYNPSFFKKINHWIEFNLNNRYYMGQNIGLDHNNTIIYITQIGFESEKELSFFMIACPHL